MVAVTIHEKMQLWTNTSCMYSDIAQELVLDPMLSDIFSSGVEENTNSLPTKFDVKQWLREC